MKNLMISILITLGTFFTIALIALSANMATAEPAMCNYSIKTNTVDNSLLCINDNAASIKDTLNTANAISAATANAIPSSGNYKAAVGYADGEFGYALGLRFDLSDNADITGTIATTFDNDYTIGVGVEFSF